MEHFFLHTNCLEDIKSTHETDICACVICLRTRTAAQDHTSVTISKM